MIQPIVPVIKRASFKCAQPGKGLTAFFLAAVLMFSCQTNSKSKHKNSTKDSLLIQLPVAKPVAAAEYKRISLACEQWFDTTLKPCNFNGSILIAKNGTTVFEKYCGSGHIPGTDMINANTPTHIASVSKTFTAMAVLKLVQEGKVELDAELSKYFPSFNYPGVTVRNLLNHRSGLPNYLYFMDELGWDKKKYMANQDVFDYLVNRKAELTNIATPDRHFTYCNTNYALLALLIEKMSGLTYPQFIKQNFFDPLQMTHSFVFTASDSARVNPSYDWRGGLMQLNSLDRVYGDKNIYTTPRDLLKWDRVLGTNLIFKPAILEQAYAPYSNEKPGIRNYGLGWRMNIYPDGKKMIYHNGWWHGNNAAFIRLLDEDVTIIVMGNRFCRGIYKARNLVNVFNPDLQQVEEEAEGK